MMELILWRHADAEDAGPAGDLARRLTKRGRKQAERMGEWLRPLLTDGWIVLSSPAERAKETAEALGVGYEVRPGLAPGLSAAATLREAEWPDGEHNIVVVGHQPTLGEVVAQLLGGSGDVPFRKAGIWWFAIRERDGVHTILRAVLDPEILEARG
jgi:phosphohistidine phosphatase